ncbi:VapE domain-containing protein [Parabacteroides sp.]
MIKVTLFTNFKSRKGDVNLIDTLDDIRNGKYAPAVNRIRTCMDQGDPETADALKKQLPAITISATYGKQRLKEYMTAYNPLVILDFDGLKHDDLPRLMTLIREACYTVACWISPRGRGIKIIAYPAAGIETVAGNHPALYKLVKDWYERLLGVGADTSGSDAGRLCILSYDPMLYLSPRFVPWLKGEGTLPGDLPVMEAVADKKLSPLISAARRKTTHKYTYTEGNRNNYVHLFACHCNRMGVPRAEVEAYAAKSFNDLPPEELRQAIDSAYTHTEQYATEKPAPRSHRGDGFVFQIQTFLNEHFNLRRNIVKRVAEYRNLKRHGAYKQVIDYWENSVWCALQKAGVFCRLSDLRAVIHSDFSPEYNPFQSYFENLPRWDGKGDPIGDLAATVDTTRPEFWVKCLRKWLVAVVACAINERKANHTVLLLSGAQGLGKTTWLRNLVPPALRDYVYSGNLDPTAKDSSLLMSDCFLIILDELSGQSRVELNQLKALITKDSILERRPYARNAELFVRRASFAATVNDSQILTDRTGSRRFLCFETLRIDYLSEIDHAAIYAQALALYKQGFRYWFADGDIAEINDNNEPFQQSSPEAELFFTFFRKPTRFEMPLLLSVSEMLAIIAERTRFSVTVMSVNMLGRILKCASFESQKRHGKRLYSVIQLDNDQVEARRKGLGCDPEDEGEDKEEDVDNKDDKSSNESAPSDPKLPF